MTDENEETRSLPPGDGATSGGRQSGLAGRSIGPYDLLRRLGEGGMGEVWEAEQTEPIRRRVALKLIKHGMDTARVIARFEAERQALALMDHGAIARVFDAGATEQGRPYFVMEYVRGEPITTYCDRHRLSLSARLDLFRMVCEGVQHAHQKAIIHRDLKPSNILVAEQDGRPLPKIIDFGIAKATAQRLTERTLFTEMGVLIGTPEYMSPEQAGGNQDDVDTRADIYSLGVILYELLAGVLPFESRELRRAGLEEILRRIREEEPPKPSTRVGTHAGESRELALSRQSDPRSLQRELQGDLDWITMKALEKNRNLRYGSPAELAADIGRHLRHEPVTATPPRVAYRLGKFVRRNSLVVGSLAAIFVVLVLATLTSTLFAVREAAQRREAEEARSDLQTVVAFQSNMLAGVKPQDMGKRMIANLRSRVEEVRKEQGGGEEDVDAALIAFDSSVRGINTTDLAQTTIDEEILNRAAQTIESEYEDRPLIAARLRRTIGVTYERLGLYERAEPHLRGAVETNEALLGSSDQETLNSLNNLGYLLLAQGKPDEAEPFYRKALDGYRRVLGPEHPNTVRAVNNMGFLLRQQGKLAEAEPLLIEAMELNRRLLGDDDRRTLASTNNVGNLLQAQGKLAEAEPYFEEALQGCRRVLGDDHDWTLSATHNMGDLLRARGKLAEAEVYLREALEGRKRVHGEKHPLTLNSVSSLGLLLVDQGKLTEAEPYYREALEGRRASLGDDHPLTIDSIAFLGILLRRQGKLDEAEPYYREVLERRQRLFGDAHPGTLSALGNVGLLLLYQGRLEEAEPYLRETLDQRRVLLGDDHPETLVSITSLGGLLKDRGDLEEAEPYLREALEGRLRVLGEDHPETIASLHVLGDLLARRGDLGEAERLLQEALERRQRVLGGAHPDTRLTLERLASFYREQGRDEEADRLERELQETKEPSAD